MPLRGDLPFFRFGVGGGLIDVVCVRCCRKLEGDYSGVRRGGGKGNTVLVTLLQWRASQKRHKCSYPGPNVQHEHISEPFGAKHFTLAP